MADNYDMYVLTLKEKQLLQQLVSNNKRLPLNRFSNSSESAWTDGNDHQAPEVYVANVTDTIPALTAGTPPKPGSAECSIYQIVYTDNDPTLIAVNGFKQVVLNLSSSAIGEGWVLVVRDKYGYWFVVTGGGGGDSVQRHKRGLTVIIGTGTGTAGDDIAIDEGTPESITNGYVAIYELSGSVKIPTGEIIRFYDDGMVPTGGLKENTWIQIKRDPEEDDRWWYDGGCKVVSRGTGTGTVGDWVWN